VLGRGSDQLDEVCLGVGLERCRDDLSDEVMVSGWLRSDEQ
jgi:hypothetical protein